MIAKYPISGTGFVLEKTHLDMAHVAGRHIGCINLTIEADSPVKVRGRDFKPVNGAFVFLHDPAHLVKTRTGSIAQDLCVCAQVLFF